MLLRSLAPAPLAEVDRVRIIHGHGMGVLRRAVSEFLGTSPHVSRFYPATPAEGGTGATVMELRVKRAGGGSAAPRLVSAGCALDGNLK